MHGAKRSQRTVIAVVGERGMHWNRHTEGGSTCFVVDGFALGT